MTTAYDAGIMNPFDALGVIVVEIENVAINFMVNRNPLYARLPRTERGSLSFKVASNAYRPNSQLLTGNGGAITSGATTLKVADNSMFMLGDVIEIDTEAMIINANPNSDGVTLSVTRGYEGTAAASHNDGVTTWLIGNSRTGGENEVQGITRKPTTVTQQFQTFQHPYQISGALASATDYALPPGMSSVLGFQRSIAIQEATDDVERSSYYGYGYSPVVNTDRPAMLGLRSLIQTNKTLSPTNAAAYKPSDLIRDTVQACFTGGGKADLFIVSTDFMGGLATWGMAIQRVDAGENEFGTPIDMFEAPFLAGVSIVPAPLLRPGTVIALTSEEILMAMKRPLFDKPRGSRGDSTEGDIICEAAIELHNEPHHAWVSGITGFSAV